MKDSVQLPKWLLPGLYLISRVALVMFLLPTPDAFYDLGEYYGIAQLEGWPFVSHWIEYPPLFPLLSEVVYRAVLGDRTLYLLVISLLLALAGAGVLYVFQAIAERIFGPEKAFLRTLVLFGLFSTLFFTWSFYDVIPLLFLLAGLWALFEKKPGWTGAAIGLGMLAKWFPGFALAAVLRYRPRREFARVAAVAIGLTAAVIGALWLLSPQMTAASLASQPGRSSWQTVWAYLDGNRMTGWFVYRDQRLDPAAATQPRGNPPRVSPRLTLLAFAGLGLFLFWRVRNTSDRSLLAFVGLTWVIFLAWSPGWSPQWIVYLLPLILLTLDLKQGVLLSLVFVFITLFEFPIAIGLYWWRGVFAMAGLRMLAFGVTGFLWYRITRLEDPVLP